MLGWLIPKEFCCGLVCAGILKNLDTSTVLYARIVYLSLTLFVAFMCLLAKIFSKDLYSKLGFHMPSCSEGLCLSTGIIHSVMLSLALFHIAVLFITALNQSFSIVCYQKFWILKFLIFCIILFACVWVTSVLDYYFYISFLFALAYICVQSIYLVEFTYDWNDTWFEKYSQTSSKYWAFLLIIFSILAWVANIAMFVMSCFKEEWFYLVLSFFIFCVLLTVISSSALCENGSLLSCSITVCVASYFLISGLYYRKEDTNYLVIGIDSFICTTVLVYISLIFNEKTDNNEHKEINITEMKSFGSVEESKIEEQDANENKIQINYKLFQAIMSCFCLYLGMLLTNWEWEQSQTAPFYASIMQAAVIIVFYIWTLIAPLLFPGRDFNR